MLFNDVFLSCIVTRKEKIYFTEINSFVDIIIEKGLNKEDYIQAIYSKRNNEDFHFEIKGIVPNWFWDKEDIVKEKIRQTYNKILPFRKQYEIESQIDLYEEQLFELEKYAKQLEQFPEFLHTISVDKIQWAYPPQ